MSDLISRQKALDAVNHCGICIQRILDIPSIEPDRKKGKWNRAMKGLLPEGDPQKNVGVEFTNSTVRTEKVIEHDASVTDTDGYKYHRSEYLCGVCKKKVIGGDEYCSHCGCRLEWE